MAKRKCTWDQLFAMEADLAILQETSTKPSTLPASVQFSEFNPWEPWQKDHFDRWPVIVKLSNRVDVQWLKPIYPNNLAERDEIPVSGIGTIAAARITPKDQESFVAVSMYARWLKPHITTNTKWSVGYSDASSHRIISDISSMIGSTDPSTHRLLAAGDLNTFYGATKDNRLVLFERDRTVFDRMESLGLEFMGPQLPNGRGPTQIVSGLVKDSKHVPTFLHSTQKPEDARYQLDYVFASRGFHKSVKVRALNRVEEWGASDHCRLEMDIE